MPRRRAQCLVLIRARGTNTSAARYSGSICRCGRFIALRLLTAYAIKLAILGGDEHLRAADLAEFPAIRKAAGVLSLYIIAICLINFVSGILSRSRRQRELRLVNCIAGKDSSGSVEQGVGVLFADDPAIDEVVDEARRIEEVRSRQIGQR